MLQAAILTESSLNMTILSTERLGDSLGGGEKNRRDFHNSTLQVFYRNDNLSMTCPKLLLSETTAHYKRFREMTTCQ